MPCDAPKCTPETYLPCLAVACSYTHLSGPLYRPRFAQRFWKSGREAKYITSYTNLSALGATEGKLSKGHVVGSTRSFCLLSSRISQPAEPEIFVWVAKS